MGTDEIRKRKRGEKSKRKEKDRIAVPFRYLLVCEGEKTEPNYFKSLKKLVEEKYKTSPEKELIKIDICGIGKNTNSLIEETIKQKRIAPVEYGSVWCVFDKDSFTKEQFNGAILKAENAGFKVAWSNESFELWYLLHFEYMTTGITRKAYNDKLDEIFKTKLGKKYKKNDLNIYQFLLEQGNQHEAIKNAEKLLKFHGKKTPAEMKPATTVHELVVELLNL